MVNSPSYKLYNRNVHNGPFPLFQKVDARPLNVLHDREQKFNSFLFSLKVIINNVKIEYQKWPQ